MTASILPIPPLIHRDEHALRPCDELATHLGCTLPSPRDSWDWLQQSPCDPIKGMKQLQTMDEWMEHTLQVPV